MENGLLGDTVTPIIEVEDYCHKQSGFNKYTPSEMKLLIEIYISSHGTYIRW